MDVDLSRAKDSVVVRNHMNDPSYAPYCMRCDGLRRMRVTAPFLFEHHCGAVHDERQVLVASAEVAAVIQELSQPMAEPAMRDPRNPLYLSPTGKRLLAMRDQLDDYLKKEANRG